MAKYKASFASWAIGAMPLRFLETVQVRFYHERSRRKLIKSVHWLHYKVFELLHFLETFTPESDSHGIPQKSAQESAQSIKHLKNVNEIQCTRKAHPQLQNAVCTLNQTLLVEYHFAQQYVLLSSNCPLRRWPQAMAKGKEESGHPKDEDCSLPMRLPKYEAKFDQKSFYNEYGLPLLD